MSATPGSFPSRCATRHYLGSSWANVKDPETRPHRLRADAEPHADLEALAALAEAGMLGHPELMRYGEPATKTGVRAGGELLDLRPRPSAVACFNDKVAVGVMEAAAARWLRVPEDLSVVGFDDVDVSRATTPRLTTVRQPLQEMGRTAVTMLMRQLDGTPTRR